MNSRVPSLGSAPWSLTLRLLVSIAGESMIFTALGHNSFIISHDESSLLIDPLLQTGFGDEYSPKPIKMYPPRSIDASALQNVDAILISHEHFDHFNLASLNLLPRSIPVLVGVTMISAVVSAIESLGFTVTRVPFEERLLVGALSICLYPPTPDTVHWEKRVTQLIVTDSDGVSLLVGIDAMVGEAIIEAATTNLASAVVVSNNAQITPPGVMGTLTNFGEAADSTPQVAALSIVDALLTYLAGSPELQARPILISGGGFQKDYEEMGPFPFSDQDEIARLTRELTGRDDVFGPLPGEVLEVTKDGVQPAGRVKWIHLDREALATAQRGRDEFITSGQPITRRPLLPPVDDPDAALKKVENELNAFAQAVLMSKLSAEMLERWHPATGCFFIRVVDEGTSTVVDYSLDLVTSAFVRNDQFIHLDDFSLAQTSPFGFIISLGDFVGLIDGTIQIWDLAGLAVNTWFRNSRTEAVMPLMYSWFGEQAAPHLANRLFRLQLNMLGVKA